MLWGDCESAAEPCPWLADAIAALGSLLQSFATDGVERVVLVGYPDPQDPTVHARMEALRPLLEGACSSAPLPCTWVDLRVAFAGHYDEFLSVGGLNPTSAGAKASASAIWQAMNDCVTR
ncbi:MAG TPA: hypothetical protein VLC09_04235 [Polyangiaceae bacterium]|nr:hypothetical protein [Polyangiaceae bacterium]